MRRFLLACVAATSCVLAGGCPPLPAVVQSGPCPVALDDPKTTPGDETPSKVCRADSYNQMIRCQRMQAIVRPRSVVDLQHALRANKGLHIRALGNRHSITPQYCTDGLGIDVTALRPDDPNELVSRPRVQNGKSVVEAWTSLTIHQLSEQLFLHKKSIGFSEIGFRDATVGGVLANGAHGSALDESTLLASRIVGVTLVNADGELLKYTFEPKSGTLLVQKVVERPGPPTIEGHTLEPARPVALPDALTDAPAPLRPSDVWHALLSNLGMLGIVVRVDVEVEDAFLLWVRLKRLYSDDRVDDIDALTASADVQPRVPPGWRRVGSGCNFFQVLWYPTAAGMVEHTNSGRLFTMCGVKITRDSVSAADMARLGAGKMGNNEYIMDDANWSDEQTRSFVNDLSVQQAAPPRESQRKKLARTLSGSHVIDADNAVLNPTFSGVFANFKNLGHRYMNAAWPFSRQSAANMFSCKFLEDVRYNGAVIARSGGGALNGSDFVILGPSHRLISSHLADEGHTITQLDYELAIPERNWKAALTALRARIRRDHLCLPM
ncbi:MAG TPA: FAD-dependent oxidoreductase, partial [Polyangia bacterium]